MRKIAHDLAEDDTEAAHVQADKLMCHILRMNGFYKTADIFEKMKK